MPDLVADLLCGFAGGALGGYLGLGGGIILVPALTLLAGVPITAAVPVSLSAIVVNSIAASNEYLKKGMVDFELVVILSFFMVSGNIFGSTLNTLIPSQVIRIIFAVVMVYSAFSFLRGRQPTARLRFQDKRATHLFAASALTLGAGMLAGLLGIGGGVIIVPLLYLFLGV
ncbi:MAG: sulfite exporter TauE/SafE family protein, partial [Candidatus Zixiibacteriota bacterium]